MRVISFVSQKGGTGKSTLAINLAVMASVSGEEVHVIDLDPQETTASWFQSRSAAAPWLASCRTAEELPEALLQLQASGTSLVVIDTPGSRTEVAEAAAGRSDLCLVPVRPSEADVRAIMPTVRMLAALGRPFALVLNQVPSRLAPGGASQIGDAGAVLPTVIGARIDHQHAYAVGLGVTELAPSGKAAVELAEFWREAMRRIPPGPVERDSLNRLSQGSVGDEDHSRRPHRPLAVNPRPND